MINRYNTHFMEVNPIECQIEKSMEDITPDLKTFFKGARRKEFTLEDHVKKTIIKTQREKDGKRYFTIVKQKFEKIKEYFIISFHSSKSFESALRFHYGFLNYYMRGGEL